VRGFYIHDDVLFLQEAASILRGDWLGVSYTPMTMVKAPFYPMFIAAAHVLGIPLLFAEQLLYVVACGLLAVSVAPWFSAKTRVVLFTALALNPISYAADVASRVIREGIYPALALLVMAGAIGLSARVGSASRRWAWWGGLLCLALPPFWLTREEGIWILPGIGLAALSISGLTRNVLRRTALVLAAATLCTASAMVAVMAANAARYGVFAVTEIGTDWFGSAIGALQRVRSDLDRPYVTVTRASRERIYAVSPTFRQLRPLLEGGLGSHWTRDGGCADERVRVCDDIAAGWFAWAVRDAVAALEAVSKPSDGADGAFAPVLAPRLWRAPSCGRALSAYPEHLSGPAAAVPLEGGGVAPSPTMHRLSYCGPVRPHARSLRAVAKAPPPRRAVSRR
jgi:hypothetical protein